jgi:hypothetical protein
MAIALVGTPTTGVGASTTATSVAVTVPTGSTGDLLVFGVSAGSNATAATSAPLITAPAALTKLSELPTGWCFGVLFYRFVQSGDATSYTFTLSSAAPAGAVCARYSGVSGLRYWGLTGSQGASSETVTSITFPAAGNVASTDLVLAFVGMGTSTKSTTQLSSLPTPGSWTNVVNRLGPNNAVTSSYHTVMALYSRAAAVDTPSVTGTTGQYVAENLVLIDSASPATDPPGGTIAFVNASTAATVALGPASLSINAPANVIDGHLLLLAIASSNLGKQTPPAGWIQLTGTIGAYSLGTTSATFDVNSTLWYKVASGEGASYSIAITSNQVTCAAIVAYSGARIAFPVRLAAETNTDVTAPTTTSPAPYVLPTGPADNLIVNFYTAGCDANPGTSTVTGPTSPWTQRAQIATTVASSAESSITIADKLGATDQPTATATTTQGWGVFSVALVGVPGVSNVWDPRSGPNYRR